MFAESVALALEPCESRRLALAPQVYSKRVNLTRRERRAHKTTHIYGSVQWPLYQRVNGVKLTADWSAVVGVSARF